MRKNTAFSLYLAKILRVRLWWAKICPTHVAFKKREPWKFSPQFLIDYIRILFPIFPKGKTLVYF